MHAADPSTPPDPKAIVRTGYNRASYAYRPTESAADVFGHSFSDHAEWLRPFLRAVPRGAEVLDLGCGCGVPDSSTPPATDSGPELN